MTITQPREIAVYVRVFSELASMAVHGAAARSMITNAIDALDGDAGVEPGRGDGFPREKPDTH